MVPANHRAKWTKNEEKQLLKETKMKIDIKKIAENHKRTIGAIKFKLVRFVIDLIDVEPTISLEKLLEITNLSKEELFEGFKKVNYHFEEVLDDDEEEEENNNMKEIIIIMMTILFAVNIYFLMNMDL